MKKKNKKHNQPQPLLGTFWISLPFLQKTNTGGQTAFPDAEVLTDAQLEKLSPAARKMVVSHKLNVTEVTWERGKGGGGGWRSV